MYPNRLKQCLKQKVCVYSRLFTRYVAAVLIYFQLVLSSLLNSFSKYYASSNLLLPMDIDEVTLPEAHTVFGYQGNQEGSPQDFVLFRQDSPDLITLSFLETLAQHNFLSPYLIGLVSKNGVTRCLAEYSSQRRALKNKLRDPSTIRDSIAIDINLEELNKFLSSQGIQKRLKRSHSSPGFHQECCGNCVNEETQNIIGLKLLLNQLFDAEKNPGNKKCPCYRNIVNSGRTKVNKELDAFEGST